MNKYRQHLLDEFILHEMDILGIHIKEPSPAQRTKRICAGLIMNIDDENCELLELIEISDYKELWQVLIINTGKIEFRFI